MSDQSDLVDALRFALSSRADVDALETAEDWAPEWRAQAAEGLSPVALAVRGGFLSDRLAWAFAGGYQAALRRLLTPFRPQLLENEWTMALCATEGSGNRPRDIRTQVTDNGDGTVTVSGEKSWTTLGPVADVFLVVARINGHEPEARPALKVVAVPASSEGIYFSEKTPLEFVPEVPHQAAAFDNVRVPREAVLPGDGYSDYVKPFRTVEDTFIAIATHAYLLREARYRGWPDPLIEALAANLFSLGSLASVDASSPATHVALAGLLGQGQALYGRVTDQWRGSDNGAPALRRWLRDQPLFQIASKPRELRVQRAWEQLATLPEPRLS